MRLTNALAAPVRIAHWGRPIGNGGKAKQLAQNRALLPWAKPTPVPAPYGQRRR